jgi:ornithine cyclodeaminase
VPTDRILYLCAREVARALEGVDVVGAVAAALAAHARGEAVLPAEAYLAWEHAGRPLRSLSMPGAVEGWPGVKVVNASPANPARGLPRASGLTVLFDPATGRPAAVLEGARISCLRTAAATAVAVDLLGAAPIRRMALLGAGALARCHLELLRPRLPELREVRLYDVDAARARVLAAEAGTAVCGTAEQAIRGAGLVVAVTTARSGYIRHGWLAPGALVVDASLDDVLPEVVLRADRVFVDDWALVAGDPRRLLGTMARAGRIRGPDGPAGGARPVDGELGQVLIGSRPGRRRPGETILVNPFGLAIEDIAVARRVYQRALQLGLGTSLER